MPEISIITPAYIDSEEKLSYLQKCVKSVISQKLEDWEMIIMDDKSPLEIVLPSIVDNRIKLYNMSTNSKPALARNVGVALAETDCILPLDGDDLLYNENTLETLHNHWKDDKSKFVYGDVQRLEGGKLGKAYDLPEYTFEMSLSLRGAIPITGMFSRECWERAGGWKKDFENGLEDIEFWISCGLAGFCGKRINEVVLIYRKHKNGRTAKMGFEKTLGVMRNKITLMHQKVYEGERPMGCCGGGRAANDRMNSNTGFVSPPTKLTDYPEQDKIWVEYVGGREGSWGVVGKFTGISYKVQGKHHKLQIHNRDAMIFRASGRGQDFNVDVSPPEEYSPEQRKDQPAYQPPPPEMAMIDRRTPVTFGA